MQTLLLSEQSFLGTFAAPMKDVTTTALPVEDIWLYVDQIPPSHHNGHHLDDVAHVYEDAAQHYHHVLIATDVENVFLVIVVGLSTRSIVGHHLLDLNEKYGLVRTDAEAL